MNDPLPVPPPNAFAVRRQHPRKWIWFFVLLAVLASAAIIISVRFQTAQQLSPEKLAAARARWTSDGPASYDMKYKIQRLDSAEESYEVEVRNGKAISVKREGKPLEERLFRYSTMPALFDFIATFLDEDSSPGQPRTLAIATFDANDGHLLHYVRSVASKRERVEITVTQFERI
jgi:Family of unknown function (DUF6174)